MANPAFAVVRCTLTPQPVLCLLTPPRRHRDVVLRVQDLRLARREPVCGEDLLRRARRHAAEAGFTTWQQHMRRQRQPERLVAIHEQVEHIGAADDGDPARCETGEFASRFKASSGRIPQDGSGVVGVGGQRSESASS